MTALKQVSETSFGSPAGTPRDPDEFRAFTVRETMTIGRGIKREEAAMVLEHIARQRLPEPSAEIGLGVSRRTSERYVPMFAITSLLRDR
jgi:hypothetical protein